jgi:hypothetical protein
VSFRFAARTMLELGKELISSDEVALYELIKNGIDAGSPRIEVIARVVLPYRAYAAALENLDEGVPSHKVLTDIRTALLPGAPPDRNSSFMSTLDASAGRPLRLRAALKAPGLTSLIPTADSASNQSNRNPWPDCVGIRKIGDGIAILGYGSRPFVGHRSDLIPATIPK